MYPTTRASYRDGRSQISQVKSIAQTFQGIIRAHRGTLIIIAGLAVVWLVLHTTGAALASAEEFERRIQTGQPVVVEVFSNT
jgi:hypothetical protein